MDNDEAAAHGARQGTPARACIHACTCVDGGEQGEECHSADKAPTSTRMLRLLLTAGHHHAGHTDRGRAPSSCTTARARGEGESRKRAESGKPIPQSQVLWYVCARELTTERQKIHRRVRQLRREAEKDPKKKAVRAALYEARVLLHYVMVRIATHTDLPS